MIGLLAYVSLCIMWRLAADHRHVCAHREGDAGFAFIMTATLIARKLAAVDTSIPAAEDPELVTA